ncbi:MAG: site-specific DNA-methyltransferase [Alcaligenaceae bacterium]|nr:site-specific DNA-methyltransferase [Alcaligenaceae bacterium]
MTQAVKLREKLVNKLSDLFQLNQPDLDFGFYRIMHAKAAQVQQFIDQDLLTIISDAFGQADGNQVATARGKYEAAIQQAKDFGAPNPEETKPVQEAKAAYDAARESGSNEAQVYDHLYRFFERYYDDGDFISRRYYTRETASNAAPYAIPYNGEEVKLHWANADQYYIKSAEYFSNFSFDLRQAKEVQAQEGLDFGQSTESRKVHFQIIDASEGEHGNIKAADNAKREFVLHRAQPVALNDANELIVNFEYRVLSSQDALTKEQEEAVKKEFGASNKGDLPNLYIARQILAAAKALDSLPADYLTLLSTPAPTDKIKQRPLLAKYINQYTSRNSMDYFIHKDLGGFLRRELDFYIKNEVMRLDDIENADAPAVESYLSKIKVLRQIAHKLIDFLAQLEDFQKKLWLKKKFVTETNYCITLDRVPVELYPEICANQAQLAEWIQLFAIDEIQGDLSTPAFSNPLTLEFLQANQSLVLDTQFFSEAFKAQLLASIEDFDEQCDGLLIHSENFQALQLLQERYREQVKCVYIDPPYNTGGDGFAYKDSYQHSSWLSMLQASTRAARNYMNISSGMFVSIDEGEHDRALSLFRTVFGEQNVITSVIWEKKYAPANDAKWFSENHDYLIVLAKQKDFWFPNGLPRTAKQDNAYKNADNDPRGRWRTDNYTSNKNRYERPNSWYPIIQPVTKEEIWPSEGAVWRYSQEMHKKNVAENRVWWGKDSTNKVPAFKRFLSEVGDIRPQTIWKHEDVGHNQDGVRENQALFGEKNFSSPKPTSLIKRVLALSDSMLTLDYFAGSGTTGHAVINLNREDNGKRKYVLAEMGDHFDTVLKPRLVKVAYASEWKNGKPVARNTGISHCFKYIRLESYEDTLNNLRLASDPVRQRAIDANSQLKQDYMLNYMLDVETRGSQSLLNIDAFADPTAYTLEVKKPGSDESVERTVDLIETFNYLIGLRVEHTAAPQGFNAKFNRVQDAHAPQDQTTRLVLDGRLQQDDNGPWWLRKIEGWLPADPANPNNGARDKVLIVWRKLTGDLEQDNLVLDEWFKTHRINSRDFEYATIYVNGSNNLPNLKKAEDRWKVRLIEEEFMQRMWDVEG